METDRVCWRLTGGPLETDRWLLETDRGLLNTDRGCCWRLTRGLLKKGAGIYMTYSILYQTI